MHLQSCDQARQSQASHGHCNAWTRQLRFQLYLSCCRPKYSIQISGGFFTFNNFLPCQEEGRKARG